MPARHYSEINGSSGLSAHVYVCPPTTHGRGLRNVTRRDCGPNAHVPEGHTWFVYTTHADSSSVSEMAADGGTSAPQLPCVFSPKSRQYLALCAQDGRLRVWNTDSKTLHQEYVPSAHLSATCICIAWGPCRTVKVRKAALEFSAIG